MINLYSANLVIPNCSWDPHCNWKQQKIVSVIWAKYLSKTKESGPSSLTAYIGF